MSDIDTHEPQPASETDPKVVRDTDIPRIVTAIPLICVGWFFAVIWAVFGHGETGLVLLIISVLAVVFFGLLAGGGQMAWRHDRSHGPDRDLAEFLAGDLLIATGRIKGSEALLQIAALPVALATCATAICIVWLIVK